MLKNVPSRKLVGGRSVTGGGGKRLQTLAILVTSSVLLVRCSAPVAPGGDLVPSSTQKNLRPTQWLVAIGFRVTDAHLQLNQTTRLELKQQFTPSPLV